MVWRLIALALVFAGGVWLIVGSVWPAPRPLVAALQRSYTPARRPLRRTGVDGAGGRLGTWTARHLRSALLLDLATVRDLEIMRRPVEVHAATCATGALLGGLAGPLLWSVTVLAGSPLPLLVPVWLMAVGAVLGWWIPRLLLRAQAIEARRDVRHALGAYLDVLVLLLAAHEGPESAMEIAAAAGGGPAFDELRRAVDEARLSGDPVWGRLDDLGRRLGVDELREIAAAGSLAGESGAAVRRSLTAKARSLRASALAEAETRARRNSQAMFGPLVLMGLGFIFFLIYPLLTNLTVGAG